MQQGSLIRRSRKRGPDVWQFRWADRGPFGKRIYRRRVIGTVFQYPDADSARKSITGFLTEINTNVLKRCALPMTVAEISDHFLQRELANDNLWRSYSTKRAYKAYLRRWIVPHWGNVRLSEVRTMEVESWLRRLPLAKGSCAKIRNILSVLFNHACRHELFNHNPIRLVRQGAKRRATPSVLTPLEIKALVNNLSLRAFRIEVGRHQFCPRHNERHTLNRVWRRGSLQDRIFAEARAGSSDCFGRPREMERSFLLHRSRRLGFRKQTTPRSQANMGPSDFAQVHSSSCAAARNSEAIRMAHIQAHLLDSAAKRRYRVQSHAGAVATFLITIHIGRLYAGDFARKARRTGSSTRAGIPF
jgi:hypothetical protein